ncbi:MAG: ATP-binding protein [Myxococcales bacterium]|nr:ATP-binding protein [Myxococcales bacterium]
MLRDRLMSAGLMDAGEQVPLPGTALGESERKVLWYYLKDVSEKLSVYMKLLERVELFKSIIDDKRFLYKQMEIDKDAGFRFVNKNGKFVPLGSLSSGEQHEVVLTYELLFGSQDKQLVLIDEPELSLHVLWQHKFLADMGRIANLANIDFVIATHSPSIVADRDDLMVELSGRGCDA